MNQIIEINEKNMYAVVEPYVTSAQLQAELFKRGLNTNIKGAGSQCSAMLRGHGHLDQSMGADDRNHLAVDGLPPTASWSSWAPRDRSDEWFCGDGPGPSVRSRHLRASCRPVAPRACSRKWLSSSTTGPGRRVPA